MTVSLKDVLHVCDLCPRATGRLRRRLVFPSTRIARRATDVMALWAAFAGLVCCAVGCIMVQQKGHTVDVCGFKRGRRRRNAVDARGWAPLRERTGCARLLSLSVPPPWEVEVTLVVLVRVLVSKACLSSLCPACRWRAGGRAIPPARSCSNSVRVVASLGNDERRAADETACGHALLRDQNSAVW